MSKKVFDSVIINHERVRLTRGDDFIYCHDAADMMNDMLEALQSVLQRNDEYGGNLLGNDIETEIRQAIAKALGEESGQ